MLLIGVPGVAGVSAVAIVERKPEPGHAPTQPTPPARETGALIMTQKCGSATVVRLLSFSVPCSPYGMPFFSVINTESSNLTSDILVEIY
jgi:hypothetical protein